MKGSGILRCPACANFQQFTRSGETKETRWTSSRRRIKHRVTCGRCGHQWWSQNSDAGRVPLRAPHMTQQPSTAPAQHVMQLDHWRCPIFGERWSLVRSDGKAVVTMPTEAEARDAARELGWRVREGVGL